MIISNIKESSLQHKASTYSAKPTNHPSTPTYAPYVTGQSLPYHPTTPLPQYGPIHGYNYATRHSYVHVQFGKASSYPFSKLISTEEQDGGLIKQPSMKNNNNNLVFPTSPYIKKIQHTNKQQGKEHSRLNNTKVYEQNPVTDLLRNTKKENSVRFEINKQKNLKVRFEEVI